MHLELTTLFTERSGISVTLQERDDLLQRLEDEQAEMRLIRRHRCRIKENASYARGHAELILVSPVLDEDIEATRRYHLQNMLANPRIARVAAVEERLSKRGSKAWTSEQSGLPVQAFSVSVTCLGRSAPARARENQGIAGLP